MGFKNSNKGIKTKIMFLCNRNNIICKTSPLCWFSIKFSLRGLFIKLKSVMGVFINICFNGGEREFTGITRCGVTWTNSTENVDCLLVKRL